MTKFVGLKAKTYSYLIDDSSEDKKAKGTKKCVIKQKIKFENYKNCLEANQIENKTNDLEKNQIEIDHIKENHREFMKNNKSMLESQQKFKSERHNAISEEINKVALSLNDDKRMQSVDSIETYAYGTSKCDDGDVTKEKIKEHNRNS